MGGVYGWLTGDPGQLLEKVRKDGWEVSSRGQSQTVYFNTAEYDVPFGVSLFATRDDGADSWSCDGENMSSLDDACKQTRRTCGLPVRPHMVMASQRRRYLRGDDIMIVDLEPSYGMIQEDGSALLVGCENNCGYVQLFQGDGQLMKGFLQDGVVLPAFVPEKQAYRFLYKHLLHRFGKPYRNEVPGCEIESKLEAPSEDVFPIMKQAFRDGSPYALARHFPFSAETAGYRIYYTHPDGQFKVIVRGDGLEMVRKGEKVVANSGGVSVFRRDEVKLNITNLDDQLIRSSTIAGGLYRQRRVFFVEDHHTGRMYQVSLDKSTATGVDFYPIDTAPLLQVEVEYEGRFGTGKDGGGYH